MNIAGLLLDHPVSLVRSVMSVRNDPSTEVYDGDQTTSVHAIGRIVISLNLSL